MDESIVRFNNNIFFYNNIPFIINSGEFDYFRSLKGLWKDRLEKMRQCFINTVSSSIPWNYHELSPGNYNFSGNKDLGFFLNVVNDLQMFFIPRPGPYIGSEWNSGGHPGWLLDKNIQFYGMECQFFRTKDKNYTRFSELWFQTLNTILSRFDIQRGDRGRNILLYQIENNYNWGEFGYLNYLKNLVVNQFSSIVPIITSGNKKIRGSQIFDSVNLFSTPWGINKYFEELKNLREFQPDFPPLGIEVGSGSINSYGNMDNSDYVMDNEPENINWTSYFLRDLFIGGLSGFNYYTFNGGINWDYFAGKMGTSSYNYKSPIYEWGGLHNKWYEIKLFGGFLKSFNNFVRDIFPTQKGDIDLNYKVFQQNQTQFTKKFNKNIIIKARTIRKRNLTFKSDVTPGFIFIARTPMEKNLTEKEYLNVKLTGKFFNKFESIKLSSKDSKLLPISIPIRNWLNLEFSTIEIFLKLFNSYNQTECCTLLLHGPTIENSKEFVYINVKNPYDKAITETNVEISKFSTNGEINFEFVKKKKEKYQPNEIMLKIDVGCTIEDSDNFVLIKIKFKLSNNEEFSKHILMGFINTKRAERTWILEKASSNKEDLLEFSNNAIPIISDIKFLRNGIINFEKKNDDLNEMRIANIELDVETDDKCSQVSILFTNFSGKEKICNFADNNKSLTDFISTQGNGCEITNITFKKIFFLYSFELKPNWDIGNNPEYIIKDLPFEEIENINEIPQKPIGKEKFKEYEPMTIGWSVINELDNLLMEDRVINETKIDSNFWKECDPFIGFESNGIYEGGYAIFRGVIFLKKQDFQNLNKKRMWITVPRVSDICWVFLNGYYVGKIHGFGSLQIANELLKNVEDSLNIIIYVESTGRTDKGGKEKSGLLNPIYLDFAPLKIGDKERKLKVIPLAELWHKNFKKDLWPGAKPPMGKPQIEKIQINKWNILLKKDINANNLDEDTIIDKIYDSPQLGNSQEKFWKDVMIKNNNHLGLEPNPNDDYDLMVYDSQVFIPDDWTGSLPVLEIENFSGSYWIYINNKRISSGCIEHYWSQHQLLTPLFVDMVENIEFGSINSIRILIFKPKAGAGISGDVFISRHDYSLEKGRELEVEWYINKGTLGETLGIHKKKTFNPKNEDKDDEFYSTNFMFEPVINLKEIDERESSDLTPSGIRILYQKMYWIKSSFRYNGEIMDKKDFNKTKINPKFNYDNYFIPIFLKISESMRGKLNIYLNGTLIGRYWDVGPQNMFYLPRPLLKKENDLVIFVNSDGKKISLEGNFSIGIYEISKKIKIKTNIELP